MRYEEATRYLYALAPRGMLLGLDRMRDALAQRGHPERAFRSVLVAGTNGKGSVAALVAAGLRGGGHRVGLYTSPHLHRLVERFQIDGRPIAQAEFARQMSDLAGWIESGKAPPLTFFEACTLLAFELFRARGCDLAVLEVGLGGRLDATNVVTPLVSVITKVALDHQDRLGPTLSDIAREKAGIIKPGVPVVVGARDREVRRVIEARARRVSAPVWRVDREFDGQVTERGFAVRVEDQRLDLPRVLPGAFQADNLACALATLRLLERTGVAPPLPRQVARLARVRWPGRLELVGGPPAVLLDAAHNPDACTELARHLRGLRAQYRRVVLLFGVLQDKDHAQMLHLLRPEVDALVFATPETPRALPASALARHWGGDAIDEPLRALRRAQRIAGMRGLVVAAGSMFLMAKVRAALLGKRSDPTIAL